MTRDDETTADPYPEKLERVRSVAEIVPDLVDGFRDTQALVHTLHLAAEGLPDTADGSAVQALAAAIEGRLAGSSGCWRSWGNASGEKGTSIAADFDRRAR